MKRIALAFVSLGLSCTAAMAQSASSAETKYYMNDFDGAKKEIDGAIAKINPAKDKPSSQIKVYYVAGNIYAKLAESLKDSTGVVKAREFYEKAMEIDAVPDKKGKTNTNAKTIKRELKQPFARDAFNAAAKLYDNGLYQNAQKAFEAVIWANSQQDGYTELSDSLAYFYGAASALNGQNYADAAKLFTKCMELGYEGAQSCLMTHRCYQNLKDSVKMEANLKQGLVKYPENINVLNSVIDYYIAKGDPSAALSYVDEGIKKDPNNAIYYYIRGFLDETINKDAVEADYKKAISMNPKHFESYYRLGYFYFENGAKYMEAAQKDWKNKKLADEEEASGKALYKKAIEQFEKAAENTDNKAYKSEMYNRLKGLYYQLQDYTKSQEFADKYNALQ